MGSACQNAHCGACQSAQQVEPPSVGIWCLLTGAISSLHSHYVVLTLQARRLRAWQNGQGTTAEFLQRIFTAPACRQAESRRDVRGCKLGEPALRP